MSGLGLLARLPPELRYEIYRYCLELGDLEELQTWLMKTPGVELTVYAEGADLALLRTSRAMYRDARPLRNKIRVGEWEKFPFRTVVHFEGKKVFDAPMLVGKQNPDIFQVAGYLQRASFPLSFNSSKISLKLVLPSYNFFDQNAGRHLWASRSAFEAFTESYIYLHPFLNPYYVWHMTIIIQDTRWPRLAELLSELENTPSYFITYKGRHPLFWNMSKMHEKRVIAVRHKLNLLATSCMRNLETLVLDGGKAMLDVKGGVSKTESWFWNLKSFKSDTYRSRLKIIVRTGERSAEKTL